MSFQLVDLTHVLDSNIPHWDDNCGFNLYNDIDYSDCSTNTKFRVQSISAKCGTGTHIDAPSHCIINGKNIDELELEQLFIPCIVIDLSDKIKNDHNYVVTINDIITFENTHGIITNNSFVIIRTGWDKYWDDVLKYRNELIFPSIAIDVANYLIKQNIVGLGVDTLSPDLANSDYPVHKIILGNNKYIVENIANSHLMPPIGSYVIILPIKIKNGTEAPVRIVGIINKGELKNGNFNIGRI
jgi:kynurenine formamidase